METPRTIPANQMNERERERKAKETLARMVIMAGFLIVCYIALTSTPLLIASYSKTYMTGFISFIWNRTFQLLSVCYFAGLYLQALKMFSLWPIPEGGLTAVSIHPSSLWNDIKQSLRSFDIQILRWVSEALIDKCYKGLVEKINTPITAPEDAGFFAKIKAHLKNAGRVIVKKVDEKTTPHAFNAGVSASIHLLHYNHFFKDELKKLKEEDYKKELGEYFLIFGGKAFVNNTLNNEEKGLIENAIKSVYDECTQPQPLTRHQRTFI